MILKSVDSEQSIPIWIGLLEAASIAAALQNLDLERPMTHDLFKNFIDQMDMALTKIEICDLKDNTYYARMFYNSEDKNFDMDARPSDAIAMAIRYQARIYVDDSVIEKSNQTSDSEEVVDKSEDGQKWADYLKNLDPDDFGKYKV
jgi:bifunctional DNase/RNase